MCGLLGYIGEISDKIFIDALNTLKHRGPDDWGYKKIDEINLGHRRLSIIDLSVEAKQPMIAGHGDIIGVFNGEIYNYKELKTELESKGYNFYTKSDTEVLLNAYHLYGSEALHKFNGMFSFAIYDKRNKEVFIARDRLGIKPLYFKQSSSSFIFSSEIKAILCLSNNLPSINYGAISSYLSYRYPIMNDSFFEGIEQLPPGCFMKVATDKSYTISRYWSVAHQFEEQGKDYGEDYYVDGIQRIFHSAVKYRMISDVPIGAYLSGGVDSSAIVAEMAQLHKTPVKTFTIGFDESDYNEFNFARKIANQYKTEHYEIDLSAEGYFDNMEYLIGKKDAPLGIPNEVALFLMSKELKKHISVVLSGEGADEIFGGYGRIFRSADDYRKLCVWNKKSDPDFSEVLQNSLLKKYGQNNFKNETEHFLFLYRYTSIFQKNKILHKRLNQLNCDQQFDLKFENIFNEISNASYVNKMMYAFENIHLQGLLQRVDTTTMATSVEARVPFVDHRLVEFAFTIPEKYKLKWRCSPNFVSHLIGADISETYDIPKYILKKSYEHLLPKDVLYRKKMGFPVPLQNWFGGNFRSFAESKILNGYLVSEDIINKKSVSKIIQSMNHTNNHALAMKVWMLLNLEYFFEIYFT